MAALLERQRYIDGVRAGDRAILARAITLIESDQPAHAELAQSVLEGVLPVSDGAHRVGVSGSPGAGKSTFIDAFGTLLCNELGKRVAVLAVDPTSSLSGGSILGDKTRMATLANNSHAFIRPSPTGGTLGGVTRKTRETILLCEAAGFDVVLVETVGVGQSEVVVSDMVDFFLVLQLAGAGDELQGIKRGILELADTVAITKADGDNVKNASRAQAVFQSALHLMGSKDAGWQPRVATCSALEKTGLQELWEIIIEHRAALEESGLFAQRRANQQLRWMWSTVDAGLIDALRASPEVRKLVAGLEQAVRSGDMIPTVAARQVLEAFLD